LKTLNQILLLDAGGKTGLKKAVTACTLTSLSMMIPFALTIQVFMELLKPFTGGTVDWNRLWLIFGIGLVGFAVVFLFSKNDYKKTYGNAYGQAETTRLRVAEQLRRLPMSFFNARDLSELTTNMMNDCTNIEQTMSSAIPQLFANIISATIVCAALAFFDGRMALALFASLPVALLIFWLSRKLQTRLFSGQVEAKLRAVKQSQEYLEGIKVIRACGLGGEKFKALDDAFLSLKKASLRVELVSGSIMAVSSIVLRSGIGIVAFVGMALLLGNQLSLLPLLMFLLIATRVYGPNLTVMTLLPDMLYLTVSSKRLRRLMEAAPMKGRSDCPITHFDIRFDGVSFAYQEREVLRNVTFTAPAGGITALVGSSGSGKSTIVKLAARFWDVQKGTVRVGDIDVKELDPEYLMQHISFVFQDVTLFNDTIEGNIRIGKPGATAEEIRTAAEAACCSEFIERLPDGYQTMLGENGATLSGGERQRLSIARALLKGAPMILLDEATASLDPENEVEVQNAINRLVVGKTVLIIAHKLRTIQNADQILVLEDGRLVEQGKHGALLKHGGVYAKLWRLQQATEQWNVQKA
jgi:ATP-binding cassette subfamily B protein